MKQAQLSCGADQQAALRRRNLHNPCLYLFPPCPPPPPAAPKATSDLWKANQAALGGPEADTDFFSKADSPAGCVGKKNLFGSITRFTGGGIVQSVRRGLHRGQRGLQLHPDSASPTACLHWVHARPPAALHGCAEHPLHHSPRPGPRGRHGSLMHRCQPASRHLCLHCTVQGQTTPHRKEACRPAPDQTSSALPTPGACRTSRAP